jgi:hypothetical protein
LHKIQWEKPLEVKKKNYGEEEGDHGDNQKKKRNRKFSKGESKNKSRWKTLSTVSVTKPKKRSFKDLVYKHAINKLNTGTTYLQDVHLPSMDRASNTAIVAQSEADQA